MRRVPDIIILLCLVILASIGSTSCVKEKISSDKFDPSLNLDADLATPVGYLNLTVKNFMSDSGHTSVRSNEDRILTMYYSDSISSPVAGSIFKFSAVNQQFSLRNETGSSIRLQSGKYKQEFDFLLPLDITNGGLGLRMDSLLIRHGVIRLVSTKSAFAGQQIKLDFPEATSGTSRLSSELSSVQTGNTLDISGYTFRIVTDEQMNNAIPVHIQVEIPAQEATIKQGDITAAFNIQIDIVQWDMIYGFSGSSKITLPNRSFNITYSSELPEGEYFFAEPLIRLSTMNSFGTTVGLAFQSLNAFTKESGNLPVSGPGIPISPNYFYPAYTYISDPLGMKFDEALYQRDNSNIVELIQADTRTILYQPVLNITGDKNTPGFINYKSKLDVKMNLELPFTGHAGFITLRDTIAFNAGNFNFPEIDKIQRLVFNLYFENAFPADMEVQLYLAGEDLRITDTLFAHPLTIEGTIPGEVWEADPPMKSGSVSTDIAPESINILKNSYFIIAEGKMNTTNSDRIVRIFDNQTLLLKTGLIFNLESKSNDL